MFDFKMTRITWVFFLFWVSLGAGCTSPNHRLDPKKTLTDYIALSFAIREPSDKAKLIKFMTGEVKARLESWSDDQFREAFIESGRRFLKLSFKEVKKISESEVQITYELVYLDKGGKGTRSHEAKVTNKKMSQLVLEQGHWMIANVRNIKELVEFKDELALP